MSATTVNAFPPLHAFNSSRPWFLVFIVLLHAGFFWALTHGVTFGGIKPEPKTWIVDVPIDIIDQFPPDPPEPTDIKPRAVDPVPLPKEIDYREQTEERAPQVYSRPDPTPAGPGSAVPVPAPVIVEPMVDPRIGLSEPEYPVSEIRMQHEGTVWLLVEILPNGRVGQVRVDRSSGYVKLDESAAREARRWRMKPGMKDGVATAMWKRVPITFQLKD